MVSFGEAIKNGFKNYFNFSGRSTRAEYWWFWLFSTIVVGVACILDSILFHATVTRDSNGVQHFHHAVLTFITGALLFIPGLALAVRRLRDGGRYWFWLFIAIIPFLGGLLLLIFYASSSNPTGWGIPTSPKNPFPNSGPKRTLT